MNKLINEALSENEMLHSVQNVHTYEVHDAKLMLLCVW